MTKIAPVMTSDAAVHIKNGLFESYTVVDLSLIVRSDIWNTKVHSAFLGRSDLTLLYK